jgi:hypothetical protein
MSDPGLSEEQLRAAGWAAAPVPARSVLDLVAMGCAGACCGVLLVTPKLVLRGSGTACGQCLAAGSV